MYPDWELNTQPWHVGMMSTQLSYLSRAQTYSFNMKASASWGKEPKDLA